MARRKRLCMISSEAKNEHQHDEAQGRSNGHSTNDTNDANSSQMGTTTNEHSDNHNELGGPPKKVRGPTQKNELWNMHKNKILSSMGKKLNACRNLVKSRNYDPTLSVEEIMVRQTDSRVNPEQFQHLVNRWMKPEYQRIGRSKMKEPHVTGTKSFARLAEEEVTKNNGVQLTRQKLYQKSRTRKDISIVNDKAAQVVVLVESYGGTCYCIESQNTLMVEIHKIPHMHPYKLLHMTLLIPKVLQIFLEYAFHRFLGCKEVKSYHNACYL